MPSKFYQERGVVELRLANWATSQKNTGSVKLIIRIKESDSFLCGIYSIKGLQKSYVLRLGNEQSKLLSLSRNKPYLSWKKEETLQTNLILTPSHGSKHSSSLIHSCGWRGLCLGPSDSLAGLSVSSRMHSPPLLCKSNHNSLQVAIPPPTLV